MKALSRKIILASKSPRRQQLLREAGFDFEVRTQEVEENYPSDLPVEKVAAYLARKKAAAMLSDLQEEDILLTADSTVILDNRILEKPADQAEAASFLRALSGNKHQVITGVCLCSREKERVFSAISSVFFEELTEAEIDYYIRHYAPYDKAGGYAIQEWIGLCKVYRIEGSYFNIVGLPVDQVYRELMDF